MPWELADARMQGVVKWFSNEKGYGFISTAGGEQYFFHISNVTGAEAPAQGDSVSFTARAGKNGKRAAANVVISQRHNPTPYYGKPTYRTVKGEDNSLGGAVIGGMIGGLLGPVGAAIGMVIGAGAGAPGPAYQEEITSQCLRCGGVGQVTARSDAHIGFQCKECRHFWRQRDIG